eukprot:scaffold1356_cov123-Cylindrotheca_fusiformis.AAC.49
MMNPSSTPGGEGPGRRRRKSTIASRYLEAVGCKNVSVVVSRDTPKKAKTLNDSTLTATTTDSSSASWATTETTTKSTNSIGNQSAINRQPQEEELQQQPQGNSISSAPFEIEDDCSSIESASSPQKSTETRDDCLPRNPLNCSSKCSSSNSSASSFSRFSCQGMRRYDQRYPARCPQMFPKPSPKRNIRQYWKQQSQPPPSSAQEPPIMHSLSSIRGMPQPSFAISDAGASTEVTANTGRSSCYQEQGAFSDSGAPTEVMANRSSYHFPQTPPRKHFPGLSKNVPTTPDRSLMDDDLSASSSNNSEEPNKPNSNDDSIPNTGSSSKQQVETAIDSTIPSNVQTIMKKRDMPIDDDDASSCYTLEKDPAGMTAVQHVFSLDRLDFSFEGSPLRGRQSNSGAATTQLGPMTSKQLTEHNRNVSFASTKLTGGMHSPRSPGAGSEADSFLSTEVNPPSVASNDCNDLDNGNTPTEKESNRFFPQRQGPEPGSVKREERHHVPVSYNRKSVERLVQMHAKRQSGSMKDKIQAFDTKPVQRVWKPPVPVITKKWKPTVVEAAGSQNAPKNNTLRSSLLETALCDTVHDDEKKSEEGVVAVRDGDNDTASLKSLREAWEQRFAVGVLPKNIDLGVGNDDDTFLDDDDDDDTASVKSLREAWEQKKVSNRDQAKQEDPDVDDDDDTASVKRRRDDIQRRILNQQGGAAASKDKKTEQNDDDDDGSVKNMRRRFEAPKQTKRVKQTKREDVSRIRSLFEPKGATPAPVRHRSWKPPGTPAKATPVKSKSWKGSIGRSDTLSAAASTSGGDFTPLEDGRDLLRSKTQDRESGGATQNSQVDDELSSGTAEIMGITQAENHLETVDIEANNDNNGVTSSSWQKRKNAYMKRGLSNSNLRNDQLQEANSLDSGRKKQLHSAQQSKTPTGTTTIQKRPIKVVQKLHGNSPARKGALSMQERLNLWTSRLKAEKEKPLRPGQVSSPPRQNLMTQESKRFQSFKDARKNSTSFFPRTDQATKTRQVENDLASSKHSPDAGVKRETKDKHRMQPNSKPQTDDKEVFRSQDLEQKRIGRDSVVSLAQRNFGGGQSVDTEFSDAVTLDVSIAEVSVLSDPTWLQSKASQDVHSPKGSTAREAEPVGLTLETSASQSVKNTARLFGEEVVLRPTSSKGTQDATKRDSHSSRIETEQKESQDKHKNESSPQPGFGITGVLSEDTFPSIDWTEFDEDIEWTQPASAPTPSSIGVSHHSSPSPSFPNTPVPSGRSMTSLGNSTAMLQGADASTLNGEVAAGRRNKRCETYSEAFFSASDVKNGDSGVMDPQQPSSPNAKKVTFDLIGPQPDERSAPSEVSALPPLPSPSDSNYDAVMESRHQMLLSRQRAHKDRVAARERERENVGPNQPPQPVLGRARECSNFSSKNAAGLSKAATRSPFFGRTHPGIRQSATGAKSSQSRASSRSIFSHGRTYPKKEPSADETTRSMVSNSEPVSSSGLDSATPDHSSLQSKVHHRSNCSAPKTSGSTLSPHRSRNQLQVKAPVYHPKTKDSPPPQFKERGQPSSSFYSRVTSTLGFGQSSPQRRLMKRLMAYGPTKETKMNHAGRQPSVPDANPPSKSTWGIFGAPSNDSSSMASF